jgi:hypothetical protein
MPAEQRGLDVVEREQAIFRYLREIDRAVGATVRELHEHLTVTGVTLNGREVRDTVTVQAYHKLITRLVLDGRLVEVEDPDAQRYALAPALHADTALTLDDIDQIAFELKPTEAIATLIDAREMVGANRKTVLRQAALALQKVPPRDLVRDMILAKVDIYNARVAEWREYGRDDERHRRLVEAARKELEKICYRWFGLSADAIRVPPASSVSNSGTGAAPIEKINRDVLDQELALRVFGDTVIQHVAVANRSAPDVRVRSCRGQEAPLPGQGPGRVRPVRLRRLHAQAALHRGRDSRLPQGHGGDVHQQLPQRRARRERLRPGVRPQIPAHRLRRHVRGVRLGLARRAGIPQRLPVRAREAREAGPGVRDHRQGPRRPHR